MDALQIVMIHQLLSRYGHVVDAGQWHRFEELFLQDVVLDYTGVNAPRVLTGIEEVRDYFRTANHPSAHHVSNVDVERVDGEVRVRSKFLVPYTRPSHDAHRWYGGDYDDVVVETFAGWRFASRTCTARWQLTPEHVDLPARRRSF